MCVQSYVKIEALHPFTANEILENGRADVVMLARELLRNADFVFDAAQGKQPSVKKVGENFEILID